MAAPTDQPKIAYVYFLFEHKSESDPLTALQLLSYIVKFWERRAREGLSLCPVLPLVVHHGHAGWKAPRSIEELVSAPAALAAYQIGFSFPVLDLGQLSDEEIQGTPILQSVLRVLKYGRSNQLRSKLVEILQLLAGATSSSDCEICVKAIGVCLMAVNRDIKLDDMNRIVQSVFPTQIEPGSLADRLLSQGREEGREEGRKEGRAEVRHSWKLLGKIQTLQELIGDGVSSDEELEQHDLQTLEAMINSLQERLRRRK